MAIDLGQVVGQSRNTMGTDHAFLWQDGSMSNLLASTDSPSNIAWDINRSGAISGELTLTNGDIRAFYISSNGLTVYEALTNGTYSYGRGLNELGDSVGMADIVSVTNNQPAIWIDEQLIRLGTFESCYGEGCWAGSILGDSGVAYDVNNARQVVGFAHNGIALQYWDPFIWFDTNTNGQRDYEEMINLGTLGGYGGYAYGVNERGEVVGMSWSVPKFEEYHAFKVTPVNGQWNSIARDSRVNPLMQDLGTLGGLQSVAYAINDSSDIVGWANIPSTGDVRHAFLYSGGVMMDLNSFLCPDTDWILLEARDINNSGQIVGFGEVNGLPRGFLLQPATNSVEMIHIQLGESNSPAARVISWKGQGSRLTYTLETCTSILEQAWSAPAPTNQWPSPIPFWISSTNMEWRMRFFRVKSQRAP